MGVPWGGRGKKLNFFIFRNMTFIDEYLFFVLIQEIKTNKQSKYLWKHPLKQTALRTCQSSCYDGILKQTANFSKITLLSLSLGFNFKKIFSFLNKNAPIYWYDKN
jgi:hypothetical protein